MRVFPKSRSLKKCIGFHKVNLKYHFVIITNAFRSAVRKLPRAFWGCRLRVLDPKVSYNFTLMASYKIPLKEMSMNIHKQLMTDLFIVALTSSY